MSKSEHYYPETKTVSDAVLDMIGIDQSAIDYRGLRAALKNDRPHDVPNRDFSGPF